MAREIKILTQHYHPETAATAQLLTDLADGLQERGFEVSVCTVQPSYGVREDLPRREIANGVLVRRVFSTRLGRYRVVLRLVDAGTFCASVVCRLLLARRTHLLIVSNPPFLMWVGWLLSVLRRYRYTLLVHDVYPDVAVRLGFLEEHGLVVWGWRVLNRLAYRRAQRIIALGERMRDQLLLQAGVESEKLAVIHNWAKPTAIRPRPKDENPFAQEQMITDKLVVLYSGNMGRFHDLETIIEAAERLRDRKDIVFLFIGDGAKREKLVAQAKELALDNVRFLPYQPVDRLALTIPSGDIGVVTLESGTEGLCVPSKLYSYLSGGIAILALLGEGSEVADIVDRWDCGVRVAQGDVSGVVRCIDRWDKDREFLKRQGMNARKCLESQFAMARAVDQYAELLAGASDA